MAGKIRVIEARENYQKVSKDVIFNTGVDVFTLGIYVKVLCLGTKWEMTIQGLAKALAVSPDRVRKSFSILEEAGFIRRAHIKDEAGHFTGWDYEISAEPFPYVAKNPTSEKSNVGKIQCWENPTSEKPDAINRDIESKTETEKKNKDSLPPFVPPTIKEVADFARTRGFRDPVGFAKHFVTYYELSNWHLSNGKPMKNWKRAVLTWEPDSKNRIYSQPQMKTAKQLTAEEYQKMMTR